MLAIFNPIRRILLRWRLTELRTRMTEDEKAVARWPTHSRPVYLQEIARLQGNLDRLAGDAGQVSFILTPKAK